MKKIPIKLSYESMNFFLQLLQQAANTCNNKLVAAVLLECWVKHHGKVQFQFKGQRTIQLSLSQGLAVQYAVGNYKLDELDSYALAVITTIYQTIHKHTV